MAEAIQDIKLHSQMLQQAEQADTITATHPFALAAPAAGPSGDSPSRMTSRAAVTAAACRASTTTSLSLAQSFDNHSLDNHSFGEPSPNTPVAVCSPSPSVPDGGDGEAEANIRAAREVVACTHMPRLWTRAHTRACMQTLRRRGQAMAILFYSLCTHRCILYVHVHPFYACNTDCAGGTGGGGGRGAARSAALGGLALAVGVHI